jgi:hypothetical protein
MRSIWMGISPDGTTTRVLACDGPESTLLKAKLPDAPHHPRALATLCEAVSLWCGRPVHAAFVADGQGLLNEHSRWSDTVEQLSGSALFRVEFVPRARRPRDRGERIDGMGDYRDVRQLIIRGLAL